MRIRYSLLALILLSVVACSVPSAGKDKDDRNPGRMLTGRVLDRDDNPVSDAVVYLSNVRTHAVKTYIVGQTGTYDFPALSSNVDYEVHAEFKGRKSDTKTVSQFDDRKRVSMILKLDTK